MLSSTTSSVWLVTLTKNALIFKFSLYLCYFPKKKLSRTYDKEINEFQTIKKLVVFALSYHNHSYQQYGLFIDYIYNEYIYTLSISVSVLYERMDIPQSNSQNVLDLLRMRVILKLFLLSFMLSFQSSKLKQSKYQLPVQRSQESWRTFTSRMMSCQEKLWCLPARVILAAGGWTLGNVDIELTWCLVQPPASILSLLSLTASTSEQNSSSMTTFFLRSSQIPTLLGGYLGFSPPPTRAM